MAEKKILDSVRESIRLNPIYAIEVIVFPQPHIVKELESILHLTISNALH